MHGIVRMFAEGGPGMYVILLAGFAGFVICTLQIALAKQANLVPLIVGSIVGVFFCGYLFSITGMQSAFRAIAHAEPSQKQALMAMGASISMNTMLLAGIFCGFLTLFGSIAATIRANVAKP